MSKKYLIYTDPHFSQYSSILRKRGSKYSERLHNLIDSINWVEETAEQYKCDEIICCGDFFNSQNLNCEEITALQDLDFSRDIKRTFIVGNHESNVSSLEYSSTKFFESIGADVIDTTTKKDINDYVSFYYVPYILCDKELKLEDYVDPADTKKKVVFAHSDLAGIQYGRVLSQSGFNINNILDHCTLFFDGHLHNETKIDANGRIRLIGNLTGQNFNEDALKYKHLAILLTVEDDGSLYYEEIENPHAINFYKIRIEKESDFKQFDSLKTNCVVSVVCINTLTARFNKVIEKYKDRILDYRLTTVYSALSDDGAGDNLLKTEDHFKLFIGFAQTKLEPSPLLLDELARLGGDYNA